MSNAEEFITKYKDLENCIKEKFDLKNYDSALVELGKQPQFKHLKNDLDYLREVRNLLQHRPNIKGEYPIEPSIGLVEKIDTILSFLNNPPTVYSSCIRINDICFAEWDDLISPYMKIMREKVYTHIPILNEGIVEGVFSENTLFGALIEDELVYEKDKTNFNDNLIKKYSLIESHVSESFLFISKNTYIEDMKEMFNNAFNQRKRISMVFITENGNPKEKLLGILTPWDLF